MADDTFKKVGENLSHGKDAQGTVRGFKYGTDTTKDAEKDKRAQLEALRKRRLASLE